MKPKYYIYPNRKPRDEEEVVVIYKGQEIPLKYRKQLDENRLNNSFPAIAYFAGWFWRHA